MSGTWDLFKQYVKSTVTRPEFPAIGAILIFYLVTMMSMAILFSTWYGDTATDKFPYLVKKDSIYQLVDFESGIIETVSIGERAGGNVTVKVLSPPYFYSIPPSQRVQDLIFKGTNDYCQLKEFGYSTVMTTTTTTFKFGAEFFLGLIGGTAGSIDVGLTVLSFIYMMMIVIIVELLAIGVIISSDRVARYATKKRRVTITMLGLRRIVFSIPLILATLVSLGERDQQTLAMWSCFISGLSVARFIFICVVEDRVDPNSVAKRLKKSKLETRFNLLALGSIVFFFSICYMIIEILLSINLTLTMFSSGYTLPDPSILSGIYVQGMSPYAIAMGICYGWGQLITDAYFVWAYARMILYEIEGHLTGTDDNPRVFSNIALIVTETLYSFFDNAVLLLFFLYFSGTRYKEC